MKTQIYNDEVINLETGELQAEESNNEVINLETGELQAEESNNEDVNLETGELQVEESIRKKPQVRDQFLAMQIPSVGEINNDLSLFVPNQALDLSEILSRSARGMSIPIVTRDGVYISKSIDDEIDVLEKMDKDLTDYSKALLRYRREQEDRYTKSLEIQRKKDELYNDWVKTLDIAKDKSKEKE